ncbi:hypothetical protein D3C81_2128230 [compost metagenome]
MFELGTAHFIGHLHRRQFLLGFTDGADFRNGINARWNVFDQMPAGFPRGDGLSGDAALVISGRCQTRIADHVTHGINVGYGGLIHAVDLQQATTV